MFIEEEEEVDEIGNIIEAMCNSDYLERLTQIFQFYASYGDSYNLISMKVSNFVKFMRETKYLPADFPLAQLQVTFKEALKVDIKTESSNDLLSQRKRKNQVSFRGLAAMSLQVCHTVQIQQNGKISKQRTRFGCFR